MKILSVMFFAVACIFAGWKIAELFLTAGNNAGGKGEHYFVVFHGANGRVKTLCDDFGETVEFDCFDNADFFARQELGEKKDFGICGFTKK